MKKIIIALCFGALVAASYFGFQKYETDKLISQITPHVKNVSIRVLNSTRYEIDSSSNVTYKEVFEKLEGDITEIDKQLIEVQTLANPKTMAVAEPSIEYIKNSQEYLRALLQKNRKELRMSTSKDSADDALADLKTSNTYTFDYKKQRAKRSIDEYEQAAKAFENSIPKLADAAKALIKSAELLQGKLAQDALAPTSQLHKVVEKNDLNK